MSLNHFVLEGKLVGDPVKLTSNNGNTYYTLDLQVGDKKHRIPCFQNVAGKVGAFKDGMLIRVEGELGVRSNTHNGKEYLNPEIRTKDVHVVPAVEYSKASEPVVDDALSQIPF